MVIVDGFLLMVIVDGFLAEDEQKPKLISVHPQNSQTYFKQSCSYSPLDMWMEQFLIYFLWLDQILGLEFVQCCGFYMMSRSCRAS